MKKILLLAFLSCSILFVKAQTTYTWAVASGDLDASTSWSPARTSPAANDILVFDGNSIATATVTNIPTRETIGQLLIINNAAVTFSSGTTTAGAGTIARTTTAVTGTGTSFTTDFILGDVVNLGSTANDIVTTPSATSLTTVSSGTIAGGTAYALTPRITISGGSNALSIASGSSLTISSSTAISLYIATGSTGSVSGAVTFTTGSHRINVKDASALTFNSGSTFTQNSGFAGSVFTATTATPSNVIFASGSTFTAGSGSNPFAITAPASKVVFNSGSLFIQTSGTPSFSGRTYGDFQLSISPATTTTVTGGSAVSINNLTVTGSGNIFAWGMTGAANVIKGNITVGTGATLNFTGAAGTTTLSGSALQTITSVNAIGITNATATLTNGNTTGIALAPNTMITVAGTLNLNGNPTTLQSTSAGTASIGAVTGTLSGAGNVTAERYLFDQRAWRLVASPVSTSQTIQAAWQEGATSVSSNPKPGYGTFIIGTGAGFDVTSSSASLLTYTNNATTGTLSNAANTSTLTPSSNPAYFLFSIGNRGTNYNDGTSHSSTTLRSNGSVLTGNQAFPVNAAGFTLVGNPYPAAVDFGAVTRSNTTQMPNSFYAWDIKLGSYGGYVLISSPSTTGGTYTATPSSPSGITNIIPSGAAIFVNSDGTNSGTLTFGEASKAGAGNNTFSNFPSSVAVTPNDLRINLNDANAHLIDGVMESYSSAYSNDINSQDALKLPNFYENISLKSAGREFALERRNGIAAKDTISFKLSGIKAATYQLQVDPTSFNEPDVTAYLEDAYLNTHTKLDLSQVSTIAFTATSDVASYKDRFSITFVATDLPKPPAVVKAGASVVAYPNPVTGKQLNLSFDGMPTGNYNISVLNSLGQTMQKTSLLYNGSASGQSINVNYTTGVYVVNIQSGGYNQNIKVVVP